MNTSATVCSFGRRFRVTCLVVVLCGPRCGWAQQAEATYQLEAGDTGYVLKAPGGRTLFAYLTVKPENSTFTANSVCCFYPVFTPSGERVVDFSPSDHPHHRGIFLAWHTMKGKEAADFWGWGQFGPVEGRVIVNKSVKLTRADQQRAVVAVQNEWRIHERTMLHETLTAAVRQPKAAPQFYLLDLDYRFVPTEDITLQHTAFGGFCVRYRGDKKSAVYSNLQGTVQLPEPNYAKPELNWPAADWYDYTMVLEDGKQAGIAVINHPDNPPTTWHNLAPLSMVNPCIVAAGPVEVKRDQTLRLRYRLVVHDGTVPAERLERLSQLFARPRQQAPAKP